MPHSSKRKRSRSASREHKRRRNEENNQRFEKIETQMYNLTLMFEKFIEENNAKRNNKGKQFIC